MTGISFTKGSFDNTKISDLELLAQEIENFVLCDPLSCEWDINAGLDRKIIFSNNESAIKSEVYNKIMRYFSERVSDVYNIEATAKEKVTVKATIDTIYGKFSLNKEV